MFCNPAQESKLSPVEAVPGPINLSCCAVISLSPVTEASTSTDIVSSIFTILSNPSLPVAFFTTMPAATTMSPF